MTVIFLTQTTQHFSKVFDIPFLSLGQRVIIAFGGFVFFIGLAALTLAILGAFNFEVAVTLQGLSLGGEIFLGLGVINVITGILLSFRVKEK